MRLPAPAYLDPGTGSYLLQLLVAGVLGGLFTIKLYWVRVKDIVRGIFARKRDDADA